MLPACVVASVSFVHYQAFIVAWSWLKSWLLCQFFLISCHDMLLFVYCASGWMVEYCYQMLKWNSLSLFFYWLLSLLFGLYVAVTTLAYGAERCFLFLPNAICWCMPMFGMHHFPLCFCVSSLGLSIFSLCCTAALVSVAGRFVVSNCFLCIFFVLCLVLLVLSVQSDFLSTAWSYMC